MVKTNSEPEIESDYQFSSVQNVIIFSLWSLWISRLKSVSSLLKWTPLFSGSYRHESELKSVSLWVKAFLWTLERKQQIVFPLCSENIMYFPLCEGFKLQ